MLSDDRPTDPAWLPIFSKKEHFMGNAFGMIPGLELDEWSNDACRGYVIMAISHNCTSEHAWVLSVVHAG